MAIRVIKKGYRRETAERTCPTCHSVLQYRKEDVQISQQYNSEDYWITCPVCGHNIETNPSADFPWVDTSGGYWEN